MKYRDAGILARSFYIEGSPFLPSYVNIERLRSRHSLGRKPVGYSVEVPDFQPRRGVRFPGDLSPNGLDLLSIFMSPGCARGYILTPLRG